MASQFPVDKHHKHQTLTHYFTTKMQQQSQKRILILASSSLYRKFLMERLGLPFEVFSPAIDETPNKEESAAGLVSRLAGEKARITSRKYPGCTVIGSDQAAVCDGGIVGKPGSAAKAVDQLLSFSGRTVQFLTAVCLRCDETAFCFERTVSTDVCFRQLSAQEVRRYVELEKPLDCAGSFKSEALGISLLESMRSDDPTAIIGLPLIAVAEALRQAGIQVP